MRIIFSGNPAYGHVIPQLPLARAFSDRGDAVAVVAGKSVTPILDGEPAELLPAGPDIPELLAEVQRTTGRDLMRDGVTVETEAEFFAGARLDLGYDQSLPVIRDWKPDLIVAEPYDFIGPMAGAALGVPVATLACGPALRPETVEATSVRAATRYAAYGLEFGPARWYLDTCPPSLQFGDWRAPAGRIGLRPEAHRAAGAPSSTRSGSPDGRPRVLVSFGTIFVIPEVINPLVERLLTQNVDVRVTLGVSTSAADFAVSSDRVQFVGFTPLEELLGDVDVVLSAGGAGTVLGSLAHGIPMVLTPVGADQPIHAGRVAAAGAGIAFPLGAGAADPEGVAQAVATVLATPDYRAAAQRISAEIQALPSPAEVAQHLASDLA
jgi:UDP-N-acetylglucosamine:LPS N-acetylglucosamine transferase